MFDLFKHFDQKMGLCIFLGNNMVIYGSKLTRSTTDFSKYDLVNKIMNYDAWNFMEEKNHQKICESNVFHYRFKSN